MHQAKKVQIGCLMAVLLLALAALPVAAQEEEGLQPELTSQLSDEELKLDAYLQSFALVDTASKIALLQEAAAEPAEEFLELYRTALDFVLDNAAQISTDPSLQEILRLTTPRLAEAGDSASAVKVWQVYDSANSLEVQLAALADVGVLAADDEQTIVYLVAELQNLLNAKRAGQVVEPQIILGLVEALGDTGSPRGRPALVETVIARVSAQITAKAIEILASNTQDLASAFVTSFRNAVGAAKLDVYRDIIGDSSFPVDVKVEFARQVLEHVLGTGTNDPRLQTVYMDVRQAATSFLTANNKPEFASTFVRHFNDAIVGFDRGTVNKSVVVEVITALGGTGSPLAARRLTEFLTLINTYTQQDRPYDRQITLAVLESLKNLRNVESYNALFMVTILNYPAPLKTVAREALALIAR